MSSMVVRLHSYPRSAENVIGRLLHGRRPRGVSAGRGIWGATVHMYDLGIHAEAQQHDVFVVDFAIISGDITDAEFMVQQIGGKRCRTEVLTHEEWVADLARREAEERDAERQGDDRPGPVHQSGDQPGEDRD